ncbi:MAG: mannose-6-phosphate isomerase [Gemmatales bacterium]|nr:MAG: mannose-6-phosphate isomerase [Gemmatales bacterium]
MTAKMTRARPEVSRMFCQSAFLSEYQTTDKTPNRGCMTTPIRFLPYLRPMVWGSRRLADILGKTLPSASAYGESWEVSSHPVHQSIVAEGSWAGRSLGRLVQEKASDLFGSISLNEFPWLIKFIDADDWLSVQVHPDDEKVKTLWPGERGKTEAWFVIAAEAGSRIYAGLLDGVAEKDLRAALADGEVTRCLHSFTPQAGDCLFLPAGTVHAVGGGVVIAEVQQTSDATFRLFDWNRRDANGQFRPLHIEQALASIDWTSGPVEAVRVPEFAACTETEVARPLVRCPYFDLDYVHVVGESWRAESTGLHALIVLSGSGHLLSADLRTSVTRGQVWLVPAFSDYDIQPSGSLKLLVCSLPAK